MSDQTPREKLEEVAKFLRACRGTEPWEFFEEHAETCEKAAALLSPPAEAQEQLDRIAKLLNLEEEDGTWWLPAEPGPIDCRSVAECVEEFYRICNNEARRDAQKVERLRAALEEIDQLRPYSPDGFATDSIYAVPIDKYPAAVWGIVRRALASPAPAPQGGEG